jgi:uncharacterized protein (TIGR02996 family)
MSAEAEMLAQVRANPADRDARMVYADAVQEAGTAEAEEYATFIRACCEKGGARPRKLPTRIKTEIGKCFGGAVPVHHELMWSDQFIATSHFGTSRLTWVNGMIAGFTGPAVWSWSFLGEYLYANHPVTYGRITDPVDRWWDEVKRREDHMTRRVTLSWGQRYVSYDERDFLVRDAPVPIWDIRRFMFQGSWPRVSWTFREGEPTRNDLASDLDHLEYIHGIEPDRYRWFR